MAILSEARGVDHVEFDVYRKIQVQTSMVLRQLPEANLGRLRKHKGAGAEQLKGKHLSMFL